MPEIRLHTEIHASAEICFDLSRSIDLHKISTKHTGEEAIAGVVEGLIGLGESVTWRARHFGIWQKLTSKITSYNRPTYFVDEMVEGVFKSFRHEHHFFDRNGVVEMVDVFNYKSPFGPIGLMVDWLILRRYMEGLLMTRNRVIKDYAESGKWKGVLA